MLNKSSKNISVLTSYSSSQHWIQWFKHLEDSIDSIVTLWASHGLPLVNRKDFHQLSNNGQSRIMPLRDHQHYLDLPQKIANKSLSIYHQPLWIYHKFTKDTILHEHSKLWEPASASIDSVLPACSSFLAVVRKLFMGVFVIKGLINPCWEWNWLRNDTFREKEKYIDFADTN